MARTPIPGLKERLALLFKYRRNPRVDSYTTLEREMGIYPAQRFTWFVRPPSGLPTALVEGFLSVFTLTQRDLSLPLDQFELLLKVGSCQETPAWGWYGRERASQKPVVSIAPPSRLCFAWPGTLSISFVATDPSQPLVVSEPAAYRNLEHIEAGRPSVLMRRQFRIEAHAAGEREPGMLGLMEGSKLRCFLVPHEPAPRSEVPFYFDNLGRHTLWLLLLGDLRPNSVDVLELFSPDERKCRAMAERMFNAACVVAGRTVPVLRADFDVVLGGM